MVLHQLKQSMFSKFKLKYPILVTGMCIASSAMAGEPVDNVKAMFVGHSLINYTMPQMVKQLAESGNGLSMENAVQVMNGSPLRYNWENCREANFTGEWAPQSFACDTIEAAVTPFDTLIVTDANNPISGHHIYNQTQVYLENFTELLKSTNDSGRSFLYTSWEGLTYHQGEWLDQIAPELAEYEQIADEAEALSAERGRNAEIEVIPANLAIKELIIKIENGEINGLNARTDIFIDDVHMNDLGNYYIANVVFSAIYNRSPEGLTHLMMNQWGGVQIDVDPALATQLQQLAWTVISDYKAAQQLPGDENAAPNADITTPNGAQTIQLGDELTFNATASDPDGDTNLTYLWDFAGGAANQATQSATVTFSQAGTFDVTFTVTDSQGEADPSPSTVQIVVTDPTTPTNHPPQGSIVLPSGPQTINVGDSLLFAADATDADGDTNLTYRWDFAGGAVTQNGAGLDPVVFEQAGTYTVSLTVTDSEGLADPTPETVVITVEEIAIETIDNFSATSLTNDGSSTLTWNEPSNALDITAYNILINGVLTEAILAPASGFDLTGLDTSRTNQLQVNAYGTDGSIVAESQTLTLAAIDVNPNAAPNERSALGINMTGLSYWSTQWATIDIMKHASNGSGSLWATGNSQTGAFNTGHQDIIDADENGWPQSLPASDDENFHHVTTILYQDNQHYAPGEYTILYEGEGQMRYFGVTHLPEKSSPGKDVVRLDADSFFHLRILQTDPNNNGEYLRNIRVLSPGGICGNDPLAFAATSADCANEDDFADFERVYNHLTFHPLFLQDMKKYRTIRFMQAMSINVSGQAVWADRPTHTDASWGLRSGMPVEAAVELANQVQADAWLNVPARVDDDYMRQYAQLVKANLDSNLSFHIELGNEIWNNAWPYIQDAIWMREQGKAFWPDAGVDDFMYRLNYYGKRTADMCEIFKTEFAEEADRVNCVVASQGGNAWVGEQMLNCSLWAEQNGGRNCAHNIDSLAIGPYFGGYFHQDKYLPYFTQWANEGSAGMDKLFEEINSGVLRGLTFDPQGNGWEQAPEGGALAQTQRHIQDNKTLADSFGLKLTAYEGGQHLTYAGNLTGDRALVNEQMFLQSNRDERMGQAFTDHFNGWKSAGGTLYMVFESTARWGSFGAFPLKEFQTQSINQTPKLAHTLAFIDANPCWWEGCNRNTVANNTVTVDDPVVVEPPVVDAITLTAEPRESSWGVALSWSVLSGDVQYYQVFRDGKFVGHTNADTTVFNNDWLALHTDYGFQIKAVNQAGVVIGESNLLTTMAGDSVAPTKVNNLVATWNGAYGFNLSWEASTDDGGLRHYLIHRNGQLWTSTDGQTTTLTDDWPPQGQVIYQVFAMDHVENLSQGSDVITAVLPSQGFTVNAATRPESWGVALSWSFSHPDIQWFQVYRDGVFVGHTDANGAGFNNDWLELHTNYEFQILAVDASENVISTSNIITTMAGDSQAPSKPTGLTVTFNGAYGFDVSWDGATDNTGIVHYLIKRNGELYTHRTGLLLDDDWPPQGEVSYQIIAVDHYNNQSEPSDIVIGNTSGQ